MDYRVILIEKNGIMMQRLANAIDSLKNFELVARYKTTEEALGQGVVFKPSLILLDTDEEENIEAVAKFQKLFPAAALLCMGSKWDAALANRIVQVGAKGYIIKPFTGAELEKALATFGKSGMSEVSETMAFFSPKGKSGKTTLIANLALSLARQSGEQVGIIDADLQFGDMAVFFNLEPESTIVEAVRDIKFLSPLTLNTYFMPVNDKVRVICGTKRPDYAEKVEPKAFTDMVRMAQSLFRYILIDLPPAFNPMSIAAAELASTTYMVAMAGDGFEIHHMKRALEIFRDGWPDDYEQRLRVIFTRVSPCELSSQKYIEGLLNYPLAAIMPNEYLLVSEAANNGRMAVDVKLDSQLAHNIDKLAAEIMGKRHLRWSKA